MAAGVYLTEAPSPPMCLFGEVKQFFVGSESGQIYSVKLLHMLSTQHDPPHVTYRINTYPCTYSHREGREGRGR
jgi:hypothetical protein